MLSPRIAVQEDVSSNPGGQKIIKKMMLNADND